MEELLIEQWNTPISVIDQQNNLELNESVKQNLNLDPKGLYIQGIFMQADVVNGNKRLYPKRILEKAVDNYIKEQINSKQQLGELNHPPRPFVDPMQSCLLIEKLWWEGNNVMGIARIITGDNAQGDKVAALIRAGWTPGVSSRGLGRVVNKGTYNEVQEGFKLTVGVDIVWGPSAPGAFVKPITENLNQSNQDQENNLNKNNSIINNNNIQKLNEALTRFNKQKEDEKRFSSLAERVNNMFN